MQHADEWLTNIAHDLVPCSCILVTWCVQVGCKLSACWHNAVLTGIAFTGPGSNDVAVAAYDTEQIHVWALT